MSDELQRLTNAGRQALSQKNGPLLEQVLTHLQRQFPDAAETYYLTGVVLRAQRQVTEAIEAFKRGLELDAQRYDIAVELANMYSISRQNGLAAELLDHYAPALQNSPRYADLAGTVYTEIGLSDRALPLFKRACELQPEAQIFKANLATCAVFVGDIDLGEQLYKELIAQNSDHRKNHYQLSRLNKAVNTDHIEQMLAVIKDSDDTARDIPIFFALGKEYEDLGEWDKSFEYYQKACAGVHAQTGYFVQEDIAIIDTVIKQFDRDYIEAAKQRNVERGDTLNHAATPIFVLGLPRTGTTLVERILSSHPQVASVGETLFLQMAVRKLAGVTGAGRIDGAVLEVAAKGDPRVLAEDYIAAITYRLGAEPFFIEKLPFNFLYCGLIAAAWPEARFVHLVRHPMDACFSMYKQVFTWAYKYSYSLADLGEYYGAYDRLRQHWQAVLGERFVEVRYEDLVSAQESQTRQLLDALHLPFDEACLAFEKNQTPSATASSVQVRSKVHQGSVGKWQHYAQHLKPLEDKLRAAGIHFDTE